MSPKARILGGWNYAYSAHPRLKPSNERHLYRIDVPTSIDSWTDWVLARDLAEATAWVKATYPGPHAPGYEPTVEAVDSGLDTVYLIL